MEQRQLELMEPARDDVRDIGRFLANRNQKAAESFVTKLVGQFKLLTRQPYLGRPRDEILINLRSLVFQPYLIFYLVSDDKIEIWRVLHTSRDVEGVIEGFFDSLPH